jgi:enoyl-CoA hydratase/carnithine racemase
MADELIVERAGDHVLVFKLNRPEVRNALNPSMTQALAEGLAAAEAHDRIRVCVLGATTPTSFCSGADLRVVASVALGGLSRAFRVVVLSSRAKPLIAAVSGPAVGGGLELCLACDMVIAGYSSSYGLPEPRRGIIAAGGGVARLPRAVPRAIALEMIATGEPMDARTAHFHGLAKRLVPTADVLPTAIELALQISACSPFAVRESLSVARRAADLPEDEVWRLSGAAGARVIAGEDAREGPRAFLEKRPPTWRS